MNIFFISQILQIILSILLVALVLIQSKGKGLTSAVGGSIGFYKSRRGIERVVFVLTVVLLLGYIVNSVYLILAR